MLPNCAQITVVCTRWGKAAPDYCRANTKQITKVSPAGTGLTFIDFKVDWFSTGIEHWTFWPSHQPASSVGHWAVEDIPLMHSRSSPSLEEKSSCTKLKLLSGQVFFFFFFLHYQVQQDELGMRQEVVDEEAVTWVGPKWEHLSS